MAIAIQPHGADAAALDRLRHTAEALEREVSGVIVGQQMVVRGVTIALLAGGHVLLEGLPGLGKTLLVRTIARALHVRDLDQSIAFYEGYCGLGIVKEHGQGAARTVWMAHRNDDRARFVLVLLGGGPDRAQGKDDMTHYGFAVPSRADVDAIAERGRREGRLFWEPQEFPPGRFPWSPSSSRWSGSDPRRSP